MTALFRIFLGYTLIVFGLVSIFIPILPTIIPVTAGILLLSAHVPFIARLVCRVENRQPGIRRPLEKVRALLHKNGVTSCACPQVPSLNRFEEADHPSSEAQRDMARHEPHDA